MDQVLLCEELRRTFGDVVAVDGVGFTIAAGETYGLLGPNGAGKTTTISMIAGLLRADAGMVTISGIPMAATAIEARRHIGLVPQEIAIYPDLTGRENLEFFGKLYGLTGRPLDARVDEVLDVIGLVERADDRAETYSGGMQRRLNIGVGLLHEPDLLILDEPTVGVDPQSRNAILENVEALGRHGMAVLYTTHYMEEAERLCDRIGIIDQGKLIAEGTRRDLVALVGSKDRIEVAASGPLAAGVEAVKAVPGVQGAAARDAGIEVVVDDAGSALVNVLAALDRAGVAVSSVDVDEPNLEDVFLHLTGKALRD